MSVNLFDKKYKSLKPIAGIPTSISVDDTLSETSENPVQNKVVNEAIDKINSDLVSLEGRQGVSNPNLLDNAWFTINSRNASGHVEFNKYGYNRWFASDGGGYNIVTEGFMVDGGNQGIGQLISKKIMNRIIGNIVTASFLFSDGTIEYGHVKITDTYGEQPIYIGENMRADFYHYEGGKVWLRYCGRGSLTYARIVRAVKLELGSESTLHLDTPPNEAEEQLRCWNSTADPTDPYANGYNPLISDAWVQKTWTAGEICISDNKLWKALVDNSEKPSEGANWTQISVADELNKKSGLPNYANIKTGLYSTGEDEWHVLDEDSMIVFTAKRNDVGYLRANLAVEDKNGGVQVFYNCMYNHTAEISALSSQAMAKKGDKYKCTYGVGTSFEVSIIPLV